jgi:hypothetical protein
MILTTHAITGAAVASILPNNPALGFAVGFVSHFLLDAIPHWDYDLRSSKKDLDNPLNNDLILNKSFIFDLIKMGFDAFLGIAISYFLFINPSVGVSNLSLSSLLHSNIVWAIIGSLFPDILQFIYFKLWRHEPLLTLQKFHIWLNRNKSLENRPVLGGLIQLILIILIVAIAKLF